MTLACDSYQRVTVISTGDKPKKLGKLHHFLLDCTLAQCVGILVLQPDVAGMLKRPDLYYAYTDCTFGDKLIEIRTRALSNKKAALQQGIDLESAVIAQGMDVVTQSGQELGYVTNIELADNGSVEALFVSDGVLANSLVGAVKIEPQAVCSIKSPRIIVQDSVTAQAPSGGLSAAAGAGVARLKEHSSELLAKAGAATEDTLTKGGYVLGRQLKKSKGMFSSFMEEFRRASTEDTQDSDGRERKE